jgi:4-amino-4-deoxy-L-arabinose transferase-like glycosyltransferase
MRHDPRLDSGITLNSPNPALVTQRAVQRLPRGALLLLCSAYLLPGLFARDPWKMADISAFGHMVNIAQGRTSWFAPTVGGLAPDPAVLPYWLGAASINLFAPLLEPALAARIPFIILLGLVLALTWLTTYHLARTEAAQPLAFAFGGEAHPVDYARAVADGALLALIATLGLLQLGHETTPELVQLAAVALYLYALAASPFRSLGPRLGMLLALASLAASGAPAMAVALGVIGAAISWRSTYERARSLVGWVLLGTGIAAGVAGALGAWGWRLGHYGSWSDVGALFRFLAWFTWPAWPLAMWTLWQWRHHLLHRHMAVPLGCLLESLLASIAMGGSDRALMLGLPALAVLAAFALPTLQRRTSSAIDWFSVFFFSVAALVIWVVYASMHTGIPAKPAANVARLVPGFVASFSPLALILALAATAAWIWLVRWRTGKNRHPLWKSLVLPAGGVALCWLLVMTLLLPPLNYARSFQSLVQRVAQHVPRDACIAAPGMSRGQVAALEYHGGFRVDAATPAKDSSCVFLLQAETRGHVPQTGPQWRLVARERRRKNDDEVTAIYRRLTPG